MSKFNLHISTPNGKKLDLEVVHISVETVEGWMTILANHSKFASSLKISKFEIELEDNKILGVVSGGIITVSNNFVEIITTNFILKDEVIATDTKDEIEKLNDRLTNELNSFELKAIEDKLKYLNLQFELL